MPGAQRKFVLLQFEKLPLKKRKQDFKNIIKGNISAWAKNLQRFWSSETLEFLLFCLASRASDGAQSRPLTSQSNRDQSRTSRVWSGEEEKLLSAQRSGHPDLWEGIKWRAGLLVEGSGSAGEGPDPPGWSAAAPGIPPVTARQPAPPKAGRDDWEHYASAQRPACSTITPWITPNSPVDRVWGCSQTPYTRVMWSLRWGMEWRHGSGGEGVSSPCYLDVLVVPLILEVFLKIFRCSKEATRPFFWCGSSEVTCD